MNLFKRAPFSWVNVPFFGSVHLADFGAEARRACCPALSSKGLALKLGDKSKRVIKPCGVELSRCRAATLPRWTR